MKLNSEQILSALKDLAKRKLKLDFTHVTTDTKVLDDLGLNSLTIFDFIIEIEREFNVELPERGLMKIKTISDLIELIQGVHK